MANKLILVSVLVLATFLLTTTIVNQDVFAKSKTHNKVDKFLRKNTVGGDKMTDLCNITIEVKGKGNFTLPIKDCPRPEPEPDDNQTIPDDNQTTPDDNQTVPPPTCDVGEVFNATSQMCEQIPQQTECTGPNEVWSAEDQQCVCKEGFDQDETEACVPIPPVPQCDTTEFFNTTSNQCEVIPNPNPDNQTETPTDNQTIPQITEAKIIGVGDVECSGDGLKVLNQIKKENPTLVLNLGDLCYDSSTSNYLSSWGTLGNLLACVIGNHDAEEDGSAELYKDFLAYCGNDYFVKQAGFLVQGLNTNDNDAGLKSQAQQFTSRLKNATFMEGTHTVIVASHKAICETPPNSHHPVTEDAKAKAVKTIFCVPIKDAVPAGVKLIFLNGHNHIMAQGQQGGITYVESGAGGRSHYECGTNTIFNMCNNTKWGYWMIEGSVNGTASFGFKDINGGVVK